MSIHSGVLDGLQICAISQVEMCLAAPRTSVNFIRCAHSFTDFSHLMLCTWADTSACGDMGCWYLKNYYMC